MEKEKCSKQPSHFCFLLLEYRLSEDRDCYFEISSSRVIPISSRCGSFDTDLFGDFGFFTNRSLLAIISPPQEGAAYSRSQMYQGSMFVFGVVSCGVSPLYIVLFSLMQSLTPLLAPHFIFLPLRFVLRLYTCRSGIPATLSEGPCLGLDSCSASPIR